MQKLILLVCLFLLSSCGKGGLQYNGYIDADLTYLSSDFSGRLTNLFVRRGESVQKNQLLFKLEQTSEHFGVAISRFTKKNRLAQRKEILDQINYDEINYRRTLKIRKANAASQNDLDVAKRELDVLKNQLAAIDFQIKSSRVDTKNKRWQIRRKENSAPDLGIIFDTYFTQDEYVEAGQPVLSLITKNNIKVVFFAPEKDLSTITLNQKVKLSSDSTLELATGHINYIANVAQYTPPIIYSREAREELVFRIEARLDNPNLNQVHLGQPISLELVR
ncbi:MAG: hemolysin D [Legionellales bacterium RIFCSPHIGHO2_12_FULL_42_9]|nr:MAG: hemolysin D [Legionellales bacterium RIFCSPHIGHO2_12_FULL_42_9]